MAARVRAVSTLLAAGAIVYGIAAEDPRALLLALAMGVVIVGTHLADRPTRRA